MFDDIVAASVNQVKGTVFADEWFNGVGESPSGGGCHVEDGFEGGLDHWHCEVFAISRTGIVSWDEQAWERRRKLTGSIGLRGH